MVESPEPSRSLLLLSSCPTDLSFHAFKSAFGPPLTDVLQRLSKDAAKQYVAKLDVAVCCPDSVEEDYDCAQQSIGLVFNLISHLCTALSIDAQIQNEVNCQVFLFHSAEGPQSGPAEASCRRFPDLSQVAGYDILWRHIFSPESEASEDLLQVFLASRGNPDPGSPCDFQVTRVPSGLAKTYPQPHMKRPWPPHYSVAVGGTFDHLHIGHRLLLSMTALVLSPSANGGSRRHLTIGITGDALLKNKKYAEEMEDWETRQSNVQNFLIEFLTLLSPENGLDISVRNSKSESHGRTVVNRLRSGIEVSYVEIFDPFGPTVTDAEISALVISGETRSGGKAVNERRTAQAWSRLDIFEVDVLDPSARQDRKGNDDFQGKISSTEIRSRLHQRRVTINQDVLNEPSTSPATT